MMAMLQESCAVAAVDLDPIRCYLENRGISPLPATNLNAVFEDGFRRFLAIFRRRGIRATFLVVGADAERPRNAQLLRRAIAEGHEIANHGLTHNGNLASLGLDAVREEVAGGEEAIQAATGLRPVGFRAPRWNVSRKLFSVLAERNYRYDSSLVPAPVAALARLVRTFKPSALPAGLFGRQADWPVPPARPYRLDPQSPWKPGSGPLWEIPAGFCAIPPAPLNCTVSALLGDRLSSVLERLVGSSPDPLVFIFHGIDLVDFHGQIRDHRLSSKPGLTDPIARKEARVERILTNIGKGRSWARLADLADCGRVGVK